MPGPEQRKRDREARRQALLRYLKSVHNEGVKQRTRSLNPEESTNISSDNTSSAARSFDPPPPVDFTTGHTSKTTSKMPIYINNTSPASLKRKAKDTGDDSDSEQRDKPKQGRENKKARLTSGYVPGTGRPYRGTAREPNSRPSGVIGALRDKSTNVTLKSRRELSKQDTKNLDRNAPKPGLLYTEGTSRSTQNRPVQGPLEVAEPEAMDRISIGRLQPTKRNAFKEDVKYRPLQALKRKSGQDLENERTKKLKISPSTAPPSLKLTGDVKMVPQARTTSFFARNQKPGHTAAIPTNVRHVQEIIRDPVPKSSKMLEKDGQSQGTKKAQEGTLGKRRRNDDAESVRSKKKLSISKLTESGDAKSSTEETSKPSTAQDDEGRERKKLKTQSHSPRADDLFDDKNGTARQEVKKGSPSTATLSHTQPANRIPDTEDKETPSEKSNIESTEDAKPSVVGRGYPHAENEGLAARGSEPRGIYNEANACYINSVLQAIANIPRMADQYRALANKVIPEVAEHVALNAEAFKGRDFWPEDQSVREKLKALLESNKSRICLGAYLGVLLNEMLDADLPTRTSSSYVFRQACGVLLVNEKRKPYNGEEPRECMEFFEKLVDRLDEEEMEECTRSSESPSLVRELFGLKAGTKIKCESCDHAWETRGTEEKFALTTSVPPPKSGNDGEISVSFTECIDAYSNPEAVDVHCDRCGKTSKALKWMQLKDLSPYVVIKLDRTQYLGIDDQEKPKFTKNTDTVSIPSLGVVTMKDGADNVRYEVIGSLNHQGDSLNYGHWTCSMKIDGQWWCLNDERVAKVAKAEPQGVFSVVCTVLLKRST